MLGTGMVTLPLRCCRRFLFQKRLSASDVGPLGRVVLPRAAAEAFLPRLPDRRGGGCCGGGTDIAFLDAAGGALTCGHALSAMEFTLVHLRSSAASLMRGRQRR